MLPLDVWPSKGDIRAPTAQRVPGRLIDMIVADAIAHAVRGVPGVLAMGQGVFAKAATYGPGKHIAGIVLRHHASGELSLEIHVVLAETTCIQALAELSSSSAKTPVLLRFADLIRTIASQTLEHLGLPAPSTVDVTIDDVR